MKLTDWYEFPRILSAAADKSANDLVGTGGSKVSEWHVLWDWLNLGLFSVGGTPVTTLDLVRVLVIVTVAWWVSKLARRALERVAKLRPNLNRASIYTLNRLLHYVVMTSGFLIGLTSIGIDLSKFALITSGAGMIDTLLRSR